ncbi:MAG: hypothetical protein ACK47P_03720, partial [Bradyrhizobium sp.]
MGLSNDRVLDRFSMISRFAQLIAVSIVCWPALAVAAGPVYDVDLYALMSGTCRNVSIAGRSYTCKAVAYFHTLRGRSEFTVVLDDPADKSHIVSFSGESTERTQDNLFELAVDRMLLKSSDRELEQIVLGALGALAGERDDVALVGGIVEHHGEFGAAAQRV